MARFTDTRFKVRALADEALARGEDPSPTAILRALGRGSASTVVDELRKWRHERQALLQRRSRTGFQDGSSGADIERMSEASTVATRPEEPSSSTGGCEQLTAQVLEELRQLATRLADIDARHELRQALSYERLEGVQKMALMAIEEAREQARFWKQAAQQARDEAAVKADAYRQAMLAAQSESRRLGERVRELEERLQQGVLPQRRSVSPGTTGTFAMQRRLGSELPAAPRPVQAWTGHASDALCALDPDGPSE